MSNEEPTRSSVGLSQIWSDAGRPRYLGTLGMWRQQITVAWRSFVAAPMTTFIAIITVSISLFLMSSLLVVLTNLDGVLSQRRTNIALHVFLSDGINKAAKKGVISTIEELPGYRSMSFITKEQAKADFAKVLGDEASLLEFDGVNPLPASFRVVLDGGVALERRFETFSEQLRAVAGVDSVTFSKGLVGYLARLVQVVRVAGIGAVLLMCAISCFLILCSIRLALYSRRNEITIMRLVGATTNAVRAPFLIEGFLLGFLGALLGILSSHTVVRFFRESGNRMPVVGEFFQSVEFLPLSVLGLLLLVGILIGTGGSYLAVRRVSLL